jgi:hypothetical protein
MFFTNGDCASDDESEWSLNEAGVKALAPEAVAEIAAYCARFERDAAPLLALAYEREYDDAQAGRDLWLTANGHGAGFWDRKALDADGLGDKLEEAARSAGERYAYIGNDGRIHFN